MAPTTMLGQVTTTTPEGRTVANAGYPILISEMLSQLPGVTYLERTSVHDPKHINRTKKAITRAFKCQMNGLGFSMVEILSPCPTNWKMDPIPAHRFIGEKMINTFKLGVFADKDEKTGNAE